MRTTGPFSTSAMPSGPATATATGSAAAGRTTLGAILQRVLGDRPPVTVTAFDGTCLGNPDAELQLHVRTPTALSYLLTAPNELGLARAYVTGHLDATGDLYTVLRALTTVAENLTASDRMWLAARLARDFTDRLRPVPIPREEAPSRVRRTLRGLRHTKTRDSDAISRHYDVSNRFYELVLGPSMAYTCACYPEDSSTLEEAQFHKFDLVCRKLDLKPGMRLLDVGSGWGGMVAHAVEHYGVRAVGVTLSREQAEWTQRDLTARGLDDRAEVRHLDYRDVAESGFDAVSSIGLTEHIGARNVPSYFRFLHTKLRPGGRLLNHSIVRPHTYDAHRPGPFIDRYVFPDGELEGVGTIVSTMQDNGFEVRHSENLREHYARTLAAWCANLDANWDAAVAEAGVQRARVWALYMAASRLSFERHELELQQVLGVKPDAEGNAAMPLRPDWGV